MDYICIYLVRFHDNIHVDEPLPVDAVDEVGAGDDQHPIDEVDAGDEKHAIAETFEHRQVLEVAGTRQNDKLHE